MSIYIEQYISKKLKLISKNPAYVDFNYEYAHPRFIEAGGILFLGLNPHDDTQQARKGFEHNYESSKEDGNLKRFTEFAQYCQFPTIHLNLLFIREPDQTEIIKLIKKPNGAAFILDQLQISLKIIKRSHPHVIVVCNTLAGTLLGHDSKGDKNVWLGLKFKFSNEFGTYLWNDIPVFFTTMFNGQYALDNGSFERLQWQVKRALIILYEHRLEKVRNSIENLTADDPIEAETELREEESKLKLFIRFITY